MAIPKKNKTERKKVGFWTNEKVLKHFISLCEKSKVVKISTDWERFRKLDKKGYFNLYNDSYLSVVLIKRKRELNGICIYCGKEKSVRKNRCQNCYEKYRKKYLESHPI